MKNPGEVLNRTLASFTSRLDQRPGFKLPKRKYSHFGEVAFDDEQFVVNGTSITTGPDSAPGGGFPVDPGVALFTYLQVDCMIVRSVPNLDELDDPPEAKELTTSATEIGSDVQALSDTFHDAFSDQTNEIVGYEDLVFNGGITWIGPEGDLIGTILTLYIQL